MSDYAKATNFASKDTLSTGNPLKIVKGTEIDTEFNNIQTAIASKADLASPTFSGSVTIVGGTITGITDLAVADGGTGASTAANARTNLGAAASGANSDITSITGLTTALTPAQGGTGITAVGTSGNVLTSNGTAWVSSLPSVLLPGIFGQVFTSSGTFTIPSNVTAIKATIVGGGNNGAAGSNYGGAGGDGSYVCVSFLTGLTPGNTLAVTVGASNGGTSSLASGTQSITTISASPSAGTGGTLNTAGNSGKSGYNLIGGIGGHGYAGLGGGGSPGTEGSSPYGVGGGGGAGYGGGGGGGAGKGAGACFSSGSGGAGKQGIVLIEW